VEVEVDNSKHLSKTMKNKTSNSTNNNRDNNFNHSNKQFVPSLSLSLPTESSCTDPDDAKQLTTGVKRNTSDP
jgi:hypothetical protein